MLSLEDKIAIQELIARFAHFSDYGEWDALEGLFTPDVVTEFADYDFRYEGVAAQISHAKDSERMTEGKNRHIYTNILIEGDGDKAVANYYLLNINAAHAPLALKMMTSGRMRDTLVRSGGGWKIAHRFVQFDQQFDMEP